MRPIGGAWHGRLHRRAAWWTAAVALIALLVASGLWLRSAIPHAAADAFDGCRAVAQASAKDNASGYALTVTLYARIATPDDGGGDCGTMIGGAQIAEPNNGAGGTLSVTLNFDTGSISNSL